MRILGRVGVLMLLLAGTVQGGETGIAARVNGTEISNFRLERYFSEYLQAQGRSVGGIRNPDTYKRLKREALDQMIAKELLWQEAQRRGISVSDAEIDKQLAMLKQGLGGDEAFARELNNAGFDTQSFTDYLRHELVASRMLEALSEVEPAAESEVQTVYDANRQHLQKPEQVWARHLLLKASDPVDPEADEASRQELLALREQIEAGADFSEVAEQHSQDSTAAEGGDLGYFSRGTMVPAFENAAFALKPGEVSQPVRTVFGWHLIKLESYLPPSPLPKEQGMQLVRDFLHDQRRKEAREAALKQLTATGKIEVVSGL
ncbi:peptidylprolyl isomerase [Pseudomonas sp.]|uniref:peptidylprolyl isomerase n=1 Tax=Pseudomonas sp. TaxID=306 RepID=UPI00257DF4FE|nr:peptidylprolyl isomerase [Pseudomonas sp.]